MKVRAFGPTMTFVVCLAGACRSDMAPATPPAAAGTTSNSQGQGSATTSAPSTSATSASPSTPTATASATGRGAAGATTTTTSTTTTNPSLGTAGAPASAMSAGAAGAAGTPADRTAGAPSDDAMDSGGRADAEPSGDTGTLPVPDALDKPGPYEILDQPDTGPGQEFRLFAPQPLGQDGLKHPIVAWSPGAGAFPEAYLTFLNRLASHGFVTLSYNSTAEGPNLVDAIDWLIAENDREGSMLYGKLDTTKIAAGGHSAGSLATYEIADDPRLTTTLHMSGGSFMPETDVPKLRKPALMVCGDAGGDGLTTGDVANPMCNADFEMAEVPVFFAVVEGAGHTCLNDAEPTLGAGTEPDDPLKALFIKATVGWLRWQLADDRSLKHMFVGDDCELCAAGSGYIVQQKGLNE